MMKRRADDEEDGSWYDGQSIHQQHPIQTPHTQGQTMQQSPHLQSQHRPQHHPLQQRPSRGSVLLQTAHHAHNCQHSQQSGQQAQTPLQQQHQQQILPLHQQGYSQHSQEYTGHHHHQQSQIQQQQQHQHQQHQHPHQQKQSAQVQHAHQQPQQSQQQQQGGAMQGMHSPGSQSQASEQINRQGGMAAPEVFISPLFRAVMDHRIDELRRLLDIGANIFETTDKMRSLLHVAVAEGDTDIVSLLLERGANVEAKDSAKNTPLYSALNVNGVFNSEIIALLLNSGADVNVKNKEQKTPLFMAVDSHENFSQIANIVDMLLEAGADIDAHGPGKLTPLSRAAGESKTEIVAMLLTHGATVHTISYNGKTPLHRACYTGSVDIIKLLLDAGADPEALDKKQNTPLRLAGHNHELSKEVLAEIEVLIKDNIKANSNKKGTAAANGTSSYRPQMNLGTKKMKYKSDVVENVVHGPAAGVEGDGYIQEINKLRTQISNTTRELDDANRKLREKTDIIDKLALEKSAECEYYQSQANKHRTQIAMLEEKLSHSGNSKTGSSPMSINHPELTYEQLRDALSQKDVEIADLRAKLQKVLEAIT
ncbi:hypothetical protein SARC_03129 [Sphaeroforma arctica JP610]|uniref:Uncharacterized protein n=1 Tax=Sphaeroforma arctica JP610 TaxID=667725 RepID=A0A0L0G8V9_9EUKA|nr:hypothetical protein SARC_03129 [Sphaeroforma arctica JP610]KNC84668.1 hypothetical protein SARC_03129 [Sphaeroforma arctica JP610]|eukprot:XP_014158570.1 hypothetical protein SARC_03129 [Sphaeroforma arctica JP610]